MESVSISELRANLLKYLTRVRQGERFNVTSKGRVLATLVSPASEAEDARARLNALSRSAVIHDVVSPFDEPWESNG